MWNHLMESWTSTASTSSRMNSEQPDDAKERLEAHRRRAAHILRYISTLHQTNHPSLSFVQSVQDHADLRPFCAHHNADDEDDSDARVLFSTYDFQILAALATKTSAVLPFSFYTTSTETKKPKRATWGGVLGGGRTNETSNHTAGCWLRLTRMTQQETNAAVPKPKHLLQHADIQTFLQHWSDRSGISVARLLTLEQLARAPTQTKPRVARFVRLYQNYLHHKRLQRRLEPIYNGLFEWYSGTTAKNHDLDLIWGLGQALWKDQDKVVDGPLLEIKVEVELARDGSLLVRPRQHTGVTLNRNVQAALLSSDAAAKWNALVEQLDPFDLNPSQPETYVRFLKDLAVECSAGGTFCPASGVPLKPTASLVLTDAFCVYSSPRPTAVWARDALAFCEQSPAAELPRAMWALTHGPGALEDDEENKDPIPNAPSSSSWFGSWMGPTPPKPEESKELRKQVYFPLPTSDAQNNIADLLLNKNFPAVVCEGPPGTGKTHTIANIVCAYLCQGKRVLVTSKGAPALSVLRERLPATVQELCVDVSMSESVGMRQLQQTVERLANKVSYVQTEREQKRSEALQEEIEALKHERNLIHEKLRQNAKDKRALLQTQKGQELFELSLNLIQSTPWLMGTLAKWDLDQVTKLRDKIRGLVVEDERLDPLGQVTGHPNFPSEALVSLAASRAGATSSRLKNAAKGALASVPCLGSSMSQHCLDIQKELEAIRINGFAPCKPMDWKLAAAALEKERAIQLFCEQELGPLISRERWPVDFFFEDKGQTRKRIHKDVLSVLESVVKVKQSGRDLGTERVLNDAEIFAGLDTRRTAIDSRIQFLSEELVACRVITELSKGFSAEAQSALVYFSQVAGKARFGKSSQPHRMTQRQRRKRQEYLDAFEKCVKYIPAWILTSSQISDYLPAECLFDLVVIDEASQSDISVLPGLLRGKQWLVVGDGKQVSPTESFLAEEQLDLYRSALPPDVWFKNSLLPGNSFFDLGAQAFSKGRVILTEHFRCAPEIISYSNTEFYNNNLVPLRLPTSNERLSPSILDVFLPGGKKEGKVNRAECDEIVKMIKEYVDNCTQVEKRSIGVISLVGEEQSRLIRGRLLDRIGPGKFQLHNILVGEPPTFQGAERDIVFLSMVCSPNRVVTQNQLMHSQRMNVALSRARDRMVLVRSIQSNHISNDQDIKLSILEFFAQQAGKNGTDRGDNDDQSNPLAIQQDLAPFRSRAEKLLQNFLIEKGYRIRSMGIVWQDALCVEDGQENNTRAAVCVEATGENLDEWSSMLEQQKSIERVGWKCLRVDGLSLLADHVNVLAKVENFLRLAGVEPTLIAEDQGVQDPMEEETRNEAVGAAENVDEAVVVVSGDEEEEEAKQDLQLPATPKTQEDGTGIAPGLGNGETAADYGNIAGLGFLRSATLSLDDQCEPKPAKSKRNNKRGVARAARSRSDPDDASGDEDLEEKQRAVSNSTPQTFANDDLSQTSSSDEAEDARLEVNSTAAYSRSSKSSKRRRLDKYSRDGRWYPSRKRSDQEEDVPYDEYIGEVMPEHEAKRNGETAMEEDQDQEDEQHNKNDDDEPYEP